MLTKPNSWLIFRGLLVFKYRVISSASLLMIKVPMLTLRPGCVSCDSVVVMHVNMLCCCELCFEQVWSGDVSLWLVIACLGCCGCGCLLPLSDMVLACWHFKDFGKHGGRPGIGPGWAVRALLSFASRLRRLGGANDAMGPMTVEGDESCSDGVVTEFIARLGPTTMILAHGVVG